MKKLVAMLLLVALVLVPVAAMAAEIEFETSTPAEEQKVAEREVEGKVVCQDKWAAYEAAVKAVKAAAEKVGMSKEAYIASMARVNEAKALVAVTKAELAKAMETLEAAKLTKDAENIKDAEWCVAREKAAYDKAVAALTALEAAKVAAEAAWKADVKAYEAAVVAQNAAARAYNRCAADDKAVLAVVDPALVGGAKAGQAVVPSAGVGR